MPENVSFNAIPVGIRTPGQFIEFDSSRAVQGLPTVERRVLVIGQRLSTGSVAAEVPTRVLDASQAEDFFGRGSQLHEMFVALKNSNRFADSWALALDDAGAGVAAAGTITFGGAVTGAGTVALYIGGHRVQTGVAVGDTPAAIATAVAASIAAQTDLPVTAAVNGGTPEQLDLTARHAGEAGNSINIRINYYTGERLPEGLTATIGAMAGGATNPDVTDAISAIGDEQYHTIVMPWTDSANLTALESELSDRFGPMEQRTGHAFAALSGNHSALSTAGSARNSAHTTLLGVYDSPTSPWIWATVLAGVVEFHGAIDPARPFQTLALPEVLPPPEASRFTQAERNLLLHDGISTFVVDSGGVPRIERVITTYQQNAFGVADSAYLDLNTVLTVDYIRYAYRTRVALRFPRHKLGNDSDRIAPGQAIVTPRRLRAELVALFRELEEVGLVENLDQFKADLIVVRSDADPNRVNAVIPPDIINQFRIFAAAVQFRL